MKKRVLAVMLVLAMLFNSLPLAYAAAGGAAGSTNGPLSLTANSRETGLPPAFRNRTTPQTRRTGWSRPRSPSPKAAQPTASPPPTRSRSL